MPSLTELDVVASLRLFFFSPARYRTTKGTGPARFGSASVVTKKQVLKDNQPLLDRLFPVPFASHQVAEDLPAINY